MAHGQGACGAQGSDSVTVLEVVLGLVVVVLWLAMIRLHAEVMVLRRERDEMAKQIKALATVYRRGVDRRPERR